MIGKTVVALVLFGLAVVAEPPSFSAYRLVVERNIFDATRQPQREAPPREPEVRPPPPVAKTLALAGVFIADDRAVALFADARQAVVAIAVGQAVEGLTVAQVDSTGAELALGGERRLRVAVGERLSDGGEGVWTVVGRAAQAPSVQQEKTERQTASQAELLQRLMERRKRELGQ